MQLTTRGAPRCLRALPLGAAVACLTLGGHALGHGGVSVVASIVVVGLAIAGAVALTATRLRLPSLAGFVVGFQVLGHWLLARMDGHGGSVPFLGHAGHAASPSAVSAAGAVGHMTTLPLPRLPLDQSAALTAWPDLRMLACHGLAALLIVACAWSSDSALHRLEAALVRLLDVVFSPARFVRIGHLTPVGAVPLPENRAVLVRRPALALPALTHRGPPADVHRSA